MASEFSKDYINADLVEDDVSPYDSAMFENWRCRLQNVLASSTPDLPYAILCAMLCAQRRGEAIGSLFSDATEDASEEDVKKAFSVFREAITTVFPFIGFSNCMSAAFGLIGELKKRDIEDIPEQTRPGFSEVDYLKKGLDTNAEIYRGVGSADAREMIGRFYPSMSYVTNASTFGYILGGCTLFPLRESECIVTASVIALGASRQARTYSKAALQLGTNEKTLEAIVDVARDMAVWTRSQIPGTIDVAQLRDELDSGISKWK